MVDRYARTHGIPMRVVLEMDALTQIKTLVSRGSAYTILAPASAQDLVETGHLVRAPIVEPVMRRPVYLVRNPEKVSTRATREVERVTIEVVEDLVKRRIWPAELERVAGAL
jgi:LysR family nitrogen assimilation transcriptional regulator